MRRACRVAVLAVGVLAAIGAWGLGGVHPVEAATDPCAGKPQGEYQICQLQQAPGNVASQAVGDAEAAFTTWMLQGAAWATQQTEKAVFGNSSTPALNPSSAAEQPYWSVYKRILAIGVALTGLFFILGIGEGLVKGNTAMMKKTVGNVVMAGFASTLVMTLTVFLLTITDDFSTYILGGTGGDIDKGLNHFAGVLNGFNNVTAGQGIGQAGSVVVLLALFLQVGGLLIWLELLARGALIYLVVALVPFMAMASIWPRFEKGLSVVLGLLFALIFSKLAIAIVMAVGWSVLAIGNDFSVVTLMQGGMIIVITAVAPFALGAIIPFGSHALLEQHGGSFKRGAAWGSDKSQQMITLAATGPSTGGAGVAAGFASKGGAGSQGASGSGGTSAQQQTATGAQSGGGGAAPQGESPATDRNGNGSQPTGAASNGQRPAQSASGPATEPMVAGPSSKSNGSSSNGSASPQADRDVQAPSSSLGTT